MNLALPDDVPALPSHPDYVIKWAETRAYTQHNRQTGVFEFEMRIAGPDSRLDRHPDIAKKFNDKSFVQFEHEGDPVILPFRSYVLRCSFTEESRADEAWRALKAAIEGGIEHILKSELLSGN
jgi:hypothetical protein